MVGTGSKRTFGEGELIFAEGDAPDVAYLIESGRVEVWTCQNGQKLTLSYLDAGEILGEMAVIDRAPRSASAQALSEVHVTEIRADQLRQRLDEADPVLRALLVGLLSRYRRGMRAARVGADAQDSPVLDPNTFVESSDQQRRMADKIRLERELLSALERDDELRVVFQPIYDLRERRIAGFEALVRWDHPTRGPVSPLEFIGLAEETSLIVPVGHYALRRACELLAQMDLALNGTIQPWIAVNISGRQSIVPDFADLLAATAQAHGLSPGRLKAEITESLALDYPRVTQLIARCRHHGIGVSLDDFGTGYSGLGHLHRLDFDAIKLDQSFIKPLPADRKAAAMVSGICDLLHGLGSEMVAEGVETHEQAQALRACGVRYLQGWLVGRPLDPGVYVDMLLNPPQWTFDPD